MLIIDAIDQIKSILFSGQIITVGPRWTSLFEFFSKFLLFLKEVNKRVLLSFVTCHKFSENTL